MLRRIARGARAVREGDVTGEQLSAIFERFAAAIEARLQGRPYHLSWAEVVAAHAIEGNPRQRFLHAFEPADRKAELLADAGIGAGHARGELAAAGRRRGQRKR